MNNFPKLKIVNYIGDYGPANFWQNITRKEVDRDLMLFKYHGFNAIILMIPYAGFKPEINSFTNEYNDVLEHIIRQASSHDIRVIARIGYLWESEFLHDRTFERYTLIIESFFQKISSIYEQDFISYVGYYINKYNFFQVMLSWEDFFWPIKHMFPYKTDDEINLINANFIEYLLEKIPEKQKICIQQRTDHTCEPIKSYSDTDYGFYNSICLKDKWYTSTDPNMILAKIFLEWHSIIENKLNLNNRKLFIDQFNIIDNTYHDDKYHKDSISYDSSYFHGRDIDIIMFNKSMDIITLLAPKLLGAIGIWTLWDSVNGQVYNGNFKFGIKGWETNGYYSDIEHLVTLNSGEFISSNFGYTRINDNDKHSILLHVHSVQNARLSVFLGDVEKILNIEPKESYQSFVLEYEQNLNKKFKIECAQGSIKILRIDCYNIELKSLMLDKNKQRKKTYEAMHKLLSTMDDK